MQLNTVSMSLDKHDKPEYYGPAPFNPTGWFNLGGLCTLSLPRDPQDALEYLAELIKTASDARTVISDMQLSDIRNVTKNH